MRPFCLLLLLGACATQEEAGPGFRNFRPNGPSGFTQTPDPTVEPPTPAPSGVVAPTFIAKADVGTREHPLIIERNDYQDSRSPAQSEFTHYDQYTAAGGEVVYQFDVPVPTTIDATGSGALFLLDKLSSGAMQTLFTPGAHASTHLSLSIPRGTWFLVVEGASTITLQLQLSTVVAAGTESTCGDPTTPCDGAIIPAPNGVPDEIDFGDGCPPGMDRASSFCIDRFEALLVGVDAAGNEYSWSPYANPGLQKVRAKSVARAIPQGYINRPQAAAACENAGKRLCTSSEWLRACQGSAATTYPYGATREDGVCNDARSHPAVEYFGTNSACVWSSLGNACINQLDDSLGRAGARAGCITEDGQRDMMGNLHEWVADDTPSGKGIFRGGFYADTQINGNGCLYKTTAHAPSHWDYSTGFRCCF